MFHFDSSHGETDSPVSGIPLAFVWTGEAFIIVGLSTWLPYEFVASTPFSEETSSWLDQKKNIDTLDYITDPGDIAVLKEGDIGPVVKARARPEGSPMFARLSLKRSLKPAGFCTVRVQNVSRKTDRKKKVTEKVEPLTKDLVLMDSMYEVIAQLEQIRPEQTTGNAPPPPS